MGAEQTITPLAFYMVVVAVVSLVTVVWMMWSDWQDYKRHERAVNMQIEANRRKPSTHRVGRITETTLHWSKSNDSVADP